MPLDEERRALDARLITWQEVGGLDGEAVAFRPAAVHAQEHLRPVLRLRSARARVERENGVVRVVGAGEQHFELEVFEALRDGVERLLELGLERLIAVLHRHLPERFRILVLRLERLELVDADLHIVELLVDLLRFLGIVPERRLAHLVLELGDLLLFRRHLEGGLHLIELFLKFPETGLDIFQHFVPFYL